MKYEELPETVSEKSMHIAAQCWTDPTTSHIVMNVNLATAFAKRFDALRTNHDCETKKLYQEIEKQKELFELARMVTMRPVERSQNLKLAILVINIFLLFGIFIGTFK